MKQLGEAFVGLLWNVAWILMGLALVAGCDHVFLGPPFCPEGQIFCATFDTRDRGELQFESHYETVGTSTFEAGPAVSPPNSLNAVADDDAEADYAILQHALAGTAFHGLIELWVASPMAGSKCHPWALYLRLDNDPPDEPMPYQVQFQLGVGDVTTYVTSPLSGIKSLVLPVTDTKIFHRVAIEVDVPKQIVAVSIDGGIPQPVLDVNLSGAMTAKPELQIGIGLGKDHDPCAVLIDDVIVYER